MRIRIDLDDNITEDEVIIRCSRITDEISQIQKAVAEVNAGQNGFAFYQGETEYFFSLEEVLFFETDGAVVNAHTADAIYTVHHRLYELEEQLPGYFIRVSKSAILNTRRIYAIEKNLSSSSCVQFQNTHKQVYVSRRYYKLLRERLAQKRG